MHRTATKGNIGVAKATADLLLKGWDVLAPICPTSPFDLVAYRPGTFLRIQVKYRTPVNGVLEASTNRHSLSGGRYTKSKPNTEIDIVCIYDGTGDRCYYVPANRCPIKLRLTASRQKNRVNFAADFMGLE